MGRLIFVIVNATFSYHEQNMCNSVNIDVAGIFYEIVNATYIAIIEIVNETFMNFGISKTQINTVYIRRYCPFSRKMPIDNFSEAHFSGLPFLCISKLYVNFFHRYCH